MPRVADHVHDHCVAVIRDAEAARSVAAAALERAPRALPSALAHASRLAVLAAPDEVVDGMDALPASLLDLAWRLAGTRPPKERAIADLALRHGLGRADLGRALGDTPAGAAALADDVLNRWDRELRPVLLAWHGAGDCEDLAAVLADAGVTRPTVADEEDPAEGPPWPPTFGALLAAGPQITAHVATCDICGDRVRAMATLRSLLAQVPPAPAPPGVRAAPSWRRHPHAAADVRRSRRRGVLVGAAAALALAAATALLVAIGGDADDEVAVLTRVPARNVLRAEPPVVAPGQRFRITNDGALTLRWRVTAAEKWIVADPAGGTLAPGATESVRVALAEAAPEGDLRVDLTVTAGDGSTAQVSVEGANERPPQVVASIDRCTVTARVEDEGPVRTVEVWWRATSGDEHLAMAPDDGSYVGALTPPTDTPPPWWVVVVDGRGNVARTPERVAPPDCTATAQS